MKIIMVISRKKLNILPNVLGRLKISSSKAMKDSFDVRGGAVSFLKPTKFLNM